MDSLESYSDHFLWSEFLFLYEKGHLCGVALIWKEKDERLADRDGQQGFSVARY